MLPNIPLLFVDIETTGLSLTHDRVIEIGIIRVENNTITQTFQSLINPQTHLPAEIERITGISARDLEKAPTFYEVKEQIYELLQGGLFVAHNARFDYGFIRQELKRWNISFSAKQLCTVKLARQLYPHLSSHNLDSIINNFQILCTNRHRAFDDAKVLWDFFTILQTQHSKEKVEEAIKYVCKRPSTPLHVEEKLIENLPEGPGVYIFYGKEGMPLYVGKSINIKERVLSHFANATSSSVEMKIAQQIESIEAISTPGELSALFKESRLIKTLQPLYNRKLRIYRRLVVLKKEINEKGYNIIHFEEIDSVSLHTINDVIAVCKTKRQAKNFLIDAAKSYGLCEKLFDLEKTKGSCFAYRLGKCKGACIGEEKPAFYNLRFLEAFSKNAIKPWPFKGPILIGEKDEFEEIEEALIFDKWCYLGSLQGSNIGYSQFTQTDQKEFDFDTYKILESYLRNAKKVLRIKTISYSELNPYTQDDFSKN